MNVLLVEDEPAARWTVEKGLREEGCVVTSVGDGTTALTAATRAAFDLIVLDVMLPGPSGLDVCRELRARGVTTPVLMLTARDTVSDRILGLDSGADDYLVKPYDFGELLARTRALLRRGPPLRPEAAVVGDLLIRPRTGEVICAGARVPLTPKEFGVLEYLARHAGEVIGHQELLDHAWDGLEPDSNVLEVYVARIRRKLEKTASRVRLRTRRGHGYVLEATPR
jgi:DNA-binding response OmpR family regulator